MKNEFSFQVQADSNLINLDVPTERVIEMVVVPPAADRSHERPALNLAMVIDKSGSMSGEKLEYVKQAALHVLDLLRENDRVAIIAYDTEVEVLSHSVPVTGAARHELKSAVQGLRSGDMTNLSGGWLRGCQEAASALDESGLNRVLLLTDGLANVGITDMEELGRHAGQLLVRGVATSTFGVGHGFNEHLLEHMANQGGGRFYYIDSPRGIPVIFEQEFQELAAITAKNVKIRLEIPAGVSAQVLGNWRSEQEGSQLQIWLGDIAGSQRREIYLKLLTPPSSQNTELHITAVAEAQGENENLYKIEQTLVLKYSSQSEVKATPLKQDLMERFTIVKIADQATEALKLERAGERERASHLMEQSVLMSAPYMSDASVTEYRNLSRRMSEGLDEETRKSRHRDEYLRKKRRDS